MISYLQAATIPIDYGEAAALSLAGFFVVLAFVLLVRYRQISRQITSSSDLGHDIWNALEDRLKRQDERILDLMGRVEVLQARYVSAGPPSRSVTLRDVAPSQPVAPARLPPETRAVTRVQTGLGETELTAINLLRGGAKSTIEIKEALNLSREHTARTMKTLFDEGLVTRDDSTKPFVYQLTESGKRYLSAT